MRASRFGSMRARGAVSVEMALVAPILIVLLFGIIISMLWLNVQLGLLTLCVLPVLFIVSVTIASMPLTGT